MKTAEEQIGTEPKKLSKEVENYILAYEWPEGEKELETAVKRACILSKGPELEVEDFDLKYRQARSIAKFVESRLKSFIRNINRFEEFNLYVSADQKDGGFAIWTILVVSHLTDQIFAGGFFTNFVITEYGCELLVHDQAAEVIRLGASQGGDIVSC